MLWRIHKLNGVYTDVELNLSVKTKNTCPYDTKYLLLQSKFNRQIKPGNNLKI